MPSQKSKLLMMCILLLGLSACNSYSDITRPKLPNSTFPAFIPTATVITVITAPTLELMPTEWLPYNPNPSSTGCGEFVATLPAREADGLSKEQLAKRLFEIYLGHYKSSALGSQCRLDDFIVKNAKLDQSIDFLAIEQNVDYVGIVQYSLQISEVPSNWVAGNGNLEKDGWVADKGLIIGVSKVKDQHILKLIGTGP